MRKEILFEQEGFFVRQPEDENSEGTENEVEPEDTESEPGERMISETEMNKILAAREKRLKQAITRQTKGLVTKDDFQELVKSFTDTQVASGSNQVAEEIVEGEDKGIKAELEKLQTQLSRLSDENSTLQKETQEKELNMKLERRQHGAESLLNKLGAVDPNQCYKIIKDNIIDDDELGEAVKIKTSHGDDYVPVNEFLDIFKEDNPHLFKGSAKSGSGAGSGGAANNRVQFTGDMLRNSKDGGMSWEDYDKNRDKIHRDLESNR